MFVKPKGLLVDIKIYFFDSSNASLKSAFQSLYLHFINQIYCTISDPAPLVTLLKLFILFVSGMLEQLASKTFVHNVMTMR